MTPDSSPEAAVDRRLKWRTKNVVVHSKPITCITFDDLVDALQRRPTLYSQGAKVEKR